jgi:signal transduction histidine kinase/ligand-binding sensor domain-containing protein/DNA-binding response OmpR family regulator
MSLLFLFFSLLIQQPALSAGQEYIIQNYTIEDGLPVNSVNQIVQDNDGYLYFATTDGLAQYDGYEFKVYNSGNTDGLFSNRISELTYVPQRDELWLQHADGALTKKRGSSFHSYSPSVDELQSPTIQMHSYSDGEFWILTENGIAMYDRDRKQFSFLTESALLKRNRAMTRSDNHRFIISSNSGLIELDPQNGNIVQLLDSSEFPIPLETVTLLKIIDGDLWVAGIGGAFRYSMISQEIDVQFTLNENLGRVWGIHETDNQSILINSSEGFFRFDSATAIFSTVGPQFNASTERAQLVYKGNNGEEIFIGNEDVQMNGETVLSTSDIISGYLDRAGSLWISTLYEGVFQIRKSVISNLTPDEIPGFENIYPVIQSRDGSIWAGSFHNGIFRFSENDYQNWSSVSSGLPAGNARFLFEDTDETIYSSVTQNGLWRFENNDWQKIEEFSDAAGADVTVESIHRTGNKLLVGTTGEMIQYQNGEFRRFNAFESNAENPFQMVRVIRENDEGTLFTGSFGYGLTILHNGTARNYTTENSGLQSNFIRDIYVQSIDTLWIATEDLGLSRVVLNSNTVPTEFTPVMESDALIHNSLHRIIEDPENRLWISSNGGIMAVNRNDLNRYADGVSETLPVLGFNESEGMVNREANGGVQTSGFISRNKQQVIFPNQRGLTVIHLSKLNEMGSEQNLIPVIEEIVFADTTISARERSEVEIPHSERNILIKFTAPNTTSPERTIFRYRLDDVNTEWEVSNDLREATFTNVPPGWHTFHLEVYHPNAQKQVQTASIDIFIPHYFYETGWFYGLMALLAFLGMMGGVRYRTRLLKKREKELQARVDQQTEALKKAAEQKSRFFSGITHELKTPLSLIVSPLDDLLEGQIELSGAKATERLNLMKRNSDRLQNLVDQILGVSKLDADKLKLTFEQVEINENSRQLLGQFQSRLDQKDITLNITADSIEEKVYIDTDAWERILINLINNAIRFSPREGEIDVAIRNQENTVTLSIKDQGPGIPPNEKDKIFDYLYQADAAYASEGTGIGLYLVKGLMERMGGTVGVLSKKGEGAEFFVTLRKGYSHISDSDSIIHFPVLHPSKQKKPIAKNEFSKKKLNTLQQPRQILIVEDNDDFRGYLQSVLKEQYPTTTASDGNEAIEIMKKSNIDLLISDVMMPNMNGLELIKTLRKQEQYQTLPVILLSAKGHEVDKEAGLSSGADIYLTKPVKSSLLISQIRAVFRRENILNTDQLKEDHDEKPLISEIREVVYRQLASPSLNVEILANHMHISRSKLYADWKEVSDISLNDFIKKIRLNEAKKLLQSEKFNVQETATAVGFSDPNYFSTSFKREFGVSPSQVT